LTGDSIGVNGQSVFIRLAKDGKGDGCRAGRVIINLDVGHDQAAGGGEGQEDKAEGEEEGGENAARFHLGDFLSLAKPIQFICNAKDSAAGMKKTPLTVESKAWCGSDRLRNETELPKSGVIALQTGLNHQRFILIRLLLVFGFVLCQKFFGFPWQTGP